MQKSLRPVGDIFAYGMRHLMCKGRQDKTGSDKRRELGMLKHSLKWLQSDGYALWCVHAHHVTTEAAGYLAQRCSQIDIWKLPGLHLDEYTHVVVVARLGQPTVDPDRCTLELVELAHGNGMSELTVQASPLYEFPAPISRKSFLFAPKVISPEIALQAVREGGGTVRQRLRAVLTLVILIVNVVTI